MAEIPEDSDVSTDLQEIPKPLSEIKEISEEVILSEMKQICEADTTENQKYSKIPVLISKPGYSRASYGKVLVDACADESGILSTPKNLKTPISSGILSRKLVQALKIENFASSDLFEEKTCDIQAMIVNAENSNMKTKAKKKSIPSKGKSVQKSSKTKVNHLGELSVKNTKKTLDVLKLPASSINGEKSNSEVLFSVETSTDIKSVPTNKKIPCIRTPQLINKFLISKPSSLTSSAGSSRKIHNGLRFVPNPAGNGYLNIFDNLLKKQLERNTETET
ncbi:hypothetical protein CDAR_534011 [Caerostris darwini]|uniref:Uncharacterized protein n=1 Tax=Caerostris darwini TaxID=1538125 RepID=A0AAV4SC51_9ARAC|nr:hypothetical protein CDAR_534011 [Caerostris darwini]